MTLNLLRTSRINPKLSSHAYLFGNHDFNRTPLLPPGTQVIIHNKPSTCASWAFHGEDGWYIGPAPEHYRCVQCYVPNIHSTRITDTIQIIPFHIPIPKANLQDKLEATAREKVQILTDIQRKNPSPLFRKKFKDALHHIADLLPHTITTKHQHAENLVQPQPQPTILNSKLPTASTEGAVHIPNFLFSEGAKSTKQTTPVKPSSIINDDWMKQPIPIPTLHHNQSINHIYQGSNKETIYTLLTGKEKDLWSPALSNELRRLANENNTVSGTKTTCFVPKHTIPAKNKITYANMVCDYRPLKTEKYRVRLTVGGDRLDYPNDASSPAASMIDAKLLINSTISDSTKGAKFMTIDIKDFFLQSSLPQPEYMRIHYKYFV